MQQLDGDRFVCVVRAYGILHRSSSQGSFYFVARYRLREQRNSRVLRLLYEQVRRHAHSVYDGYSIGLVEQHRMSTVETLRDDLDLRV